MEIINKKIGDITPYENNTKKHDETQINNVAESIKQFGYVQPIVVDKNNVIIIGHCRYEASKRLGLKEVPCVQVDLPIEKANALRIVDNKTNESDWDYELLNIELENIDLGNFEFDFQIADTFQEFLDTEELDRPIEEKNNVVITITFDTYSKFEKYEQKIKDLLNGEAIIAMKMI